MGMAAPAERQQGSQALQVRSSVLGFALLFVRSPCLLSFKGVRLFSRSESNSFTMLHKEFSLCHAGRCPVQPGIPSRCQRKPAASQSLKRKRSSLPVCAAAAVPEPVQNANTLPRNKTAGRSTYRPESFDEMVTDASSALVEAMEAGLSELEVEFPPLPSSVDSELCSGAASAWPSC